MKLFVVLFAAGTMAACTGKPMDGSRAVPDTYQGYTYQSHNSLDSKDLPRVRGVYIDGKPVVDGVVQHNAILEPIKSQQPNGASKSSGATSGPSGTAPAYYPEYYDEQTPYGGQLNQGGAYIPTAYGQYNPYIEAPARLPWWARIQRWNPFARFYRTTVPVTDYPVPTYIPAYPQPVVMYGVVNAGQPVTLVNPSEKSAQKY